MTDRQARLIITRLIRALAESPTAPCAFGRCPHESERQAKHGEDCGRYYHFERCWRECLADAKWWRSLDLGPNHGSSL